MLSYYQELKYDNAFGLQQRIFADETGEIMMPLTMVKPGELNTVKKVGGRDETRQFLSKLGFVPGACISVMSEFGGNVIVGIKDCRVAISREMAMKILV
jgi:ferrous iron transport protein A